MKTKLHAILFAIAVMSTLSCEKENDTPATNTTAAAQSLAQTQAQLKMQQPFTIYAGVSEIGSIRLLKPNGGIVHAGENKKTEYELHVKPNYIGSLVEIDFGERDKNGNANWLYTTVLAPRCVITKGILPWTVPDLDPYTTFKTFAQAIVLNVGFIPADSSCVYMIR